MRRTSGLRPHPMMLDLLMGALMLFAFQLGPNAEQVSFRDIDLPKAADDESKKVDVLALSPECCWHYLTSDQERLTPAQAVEKARKQKKTVFLLLSSDKNLQTYLDAQHPLVSRGIKVGLAVKRKEGS